jgi:hypothetical protein
MLPGFSLNSGLESSKETARVPGRLVGSFHTEPVADAVLGVLDTTSDGELRPESGRVRNASWCGCVCESTDGLASLAALFIEAVCPLP